MTAEAREDSRVETRSQARNELETELTRHHQASFGWALSCCQGDEAEAADVLQDAYLKLLDGRARFEGRSSLRTFLFGVIRRTAQERRRKRRLRRAAAWAAGGDSRIGEDPSQAILRSVESARVATALGRLSSRQRQVLHLVFYQDMTIEEAATVMGTSVGTARTHYERGKKRLRTMLGPDEPRW
jgi:RNA polymerase sigma-70 factor (ECF subfamily)